MSYLLYLTIFCNANDKKEQSNKTSVNNNSTSHKPEIKVTTNSPPTIPNVAIKDNIQDTITSVIKYLSEIKYNLNDYIYELIASDLVKLFHANDCTPLIMSMIRMMGATANIDDVIMEILQIKNITSSQIVSICNQHLTTFQSNWDIDNFYKKSPYNDFLLSMYFISGNIKLYTEMYHFKIISGPNCSIFLDEFKIFNDLLLTELAIHSVPGTLSTEELKKFFNINKNINYKHLINRITNTPNDNVYLNTVNLEIYTYKDLESINKPIEHISRNDCIAKNITKITIKIPHMSNANLASTANCLLMLYVSDVLYSQFGIRLPLNMEQMLNRAQIIQWHLFDKNGNKFLAFVSSSSLSRITLNPTLVNQLIFYSNAIMKLKDTLVLVNENKKTTTPTINRLETFYNIPVNTHKTLLTPKEILETYDTQLGAYDMQQLFNYNTEEINITSIKDMIIGRLIKYCIQELMPISCGEEILEMMTKK